MKKKLLSFLLNQYIIAFIISVLIVFLTPDYFSKYLIELKESNVVPRNDSRVYYNDLNNDSNSERILCFENTAGYASFEIHTSNEDYVDQWNFTTKLTNSLENLFFLDANGNGFKEIYLITQKEDSLFLNITEPFLKSGIHNKKVFIDVCAAYNNEYKTMAGSFKTGQSKSNGMKDVYFIVSSGFSGYPRSAYKYNFSTNKIYKSPHLTNHFAIDKIIDIDNDGFDEVLFSSYSAGNEIDSSYTQRSDYSSWLTVLDTNLNFLFDPIEFENPFSTLNTKPFKTDNNYRLISLLNSNNEEISHNKLMVHTIDGKLINEIELPSGHFRMLPSKQHNEFVLFDRNNKEISKTLIFNSELKKVSEFNLNNIWLIFNKDIDNDGKDEWVNFSKNNRAITILREDYTNPVSFEIPSDNYEQLFFGVLNNDRYKNAFYFQKGNDYFIYGYTKNQLYYFKYLASLGMYFIILGLVLLTIKGQEIRNEKKRIIENEIAELQLKTIKNQVDPHFVFNAINTMSEMMLTDDKLAADDFICKFSNLMRDTLKGSDKISHSLKEELSYVENFIQLQQIRFDHRFDYQFNIDKKIATGTNVPKHVIYSYVENAIKHGLSKIEKDGLLKIDVEKKDNVLEIIIENNGGGLDKSAERKKYSTGNGIKIMEKMFGLYYKLYKKKITQSITEFSDSNSQMKGVRIKITISGS